MKKLLIVIIALALIFILAGCAKGPESVVTSLFLVTNGRAKI